MVGTFFLLPSPLMPNGGLLPPFHLAVTEQLARTSLVSGLMKTHFTVEGDAQGWIAVGYTPNKGMVYRSYHLCPLVGGDSCVASNYTFFLRPIYFRLMLMCLPVL